MNATTLPARPASLLNKVPEVTLAFWLIKVCSTTVGETAADYLNFHLGFGLTGTTLTLSVALVAALVAQFRAPAYVAWRYWNAVLLVSVVGTLITDTLTDQFGVPLAASTLGFGAALAAAFTAWRAREGTLSIYAIDTPSRERWYWLAILLTFALGTAAGDWVAESAGLGYVAAAALFGGSITAAALAYKLGRLGSVATFWTAYVLTRPLGAALGDGLTQPVSAGGLGLDAMTINAVLLTAIVALVGWFSVTRCDVTRSQEIAP